MATQNSAFDPKSTGFIASILTAIFTITGLAGIEYPQAPNVISDDLINTFSTTGIYGILGILAVSVIAPIYNFLRKKIPLTWGNVFSSTVTWVSLGGIVVSGLLFVKLEIPQTAPAEITAAVYAKNWTLLGSLLVGSVLIPFIRWLKSRKATTTTVNQ